MLTENEVITRINKMPESYPGLDFDKAWQWFIKYLENKENKPNILELNFSGKYLSEELIEAIVKFVGTNPPLRSLSFRNARLGTKFPASSFFKSISTNKNLKKLDLSNFAIQDFDFYAYNDLSVCLKTNHTLTELYLSGHFISYEGALTEIAESLAINKGLLVLDIDQAWRNALNYEADQPDTLFRNLQHNGTLRELTIPPLNGTDYERLYQLVFLKKNICYIKVDVTSVNYKVHNDKWPYIDAILCNRRAVLGYYLKKETQLLDRILAQPLISIIIEYTGWKDEETIEVELTEEEVVTRIKYLSGDKLNILLTKWLSTNPDILSLDLSDKFLTREAVISIAMFLKKNPKLNKLSFRNAGISSFPSDIFFKAVSINTNLTELDLSFLNFDNNAYKDLSECLEKNHSLQVLDLSDQSVYSYEGLEALADGLRANKGLKKLDVGLAWYVSYNSMENNSPKTLIDILLNNRTLRELSIPTLKEEDYERLSSFVFLQTNIMDVKIKTTIPKIHNQKWPAIDQELRKRRSVSTYYVKNKILEELTPILPPHPISLIFSYDDWSKATINEENTMVATKGKLKRDIIW